MSKPKSTKKLKNAKNAKKPPPSAQINAKLTRRVQALYDTLGADRAHRALGVARGTLMSFLAGARVFSGTVALIEKNVDAAEVEAKDSKAVGT